MMLQPGMFLGPYEILALIGKLEPATQINVVLNWFEELKRRVPSGR